MEIVNILKKKLQTASRVGSQSISLTPLEINDIFNLLMKKDEEIISLQKKLLSKDDTHIELKINPTFQ